MNPPTLPRLQADVVDGPFARDYRILQPTVMPQWLAVLAIAAALAASLYCSLVDNSLPDFAAWSSTLWLVVSLASALWITPRAFTPGFLISLLPYLIAWRVAAMNDAPVLMWVASLGAVVLALQLFDCIASDWRRNRDRPGAWLGTMLWQMTLVRMYFGLNELGHATEKIFAGLGSFHTLVHGFEGFGLTHTAPLFVVLGGLTELASAIGVGLGLLARLGGFVSLGYFLVATLGFGGEWGRGYAWATAGGGGWEYVMLVVVVFASVMMTGAGKFSLDGWLLQRKLLPQWMTVLAVNAEGLRTASPESLSTPHASPLPAAR
ncbi:DoxX family protein [Pseudomonas sp. dw_358]|uniref:DoxX family protein n=1 Tax=Pseudomonas sp. dw_358 TaxID=2720083 RepID=UPI001BD5AD9C|nr:DoxX family protein [Pseudomonas sp. dw_358]